MGSLRGWVFGYGSLTSEGLAGLDRERRAGGWVADLPGFARGWGVAMDNRCAIPGYKRYRDAAGRHPALWIAFLDIVAHPAGSVTGVCRPVDPSGLRRLDARERNYERVEVGGLLGCADPVWTYVGSAAGRARLKEGRRRGRAAIQADYLDRVRRGLRALGAAEWARCAPSLAPDGLPVLALERVELPDRTPTRRPR